MSWPGKIILKFGRIYGAALLAAFFILVLTPAAFSQARNDTTRRVLANTSAVTNGRHIADTLLLKDTTSSTADTSARARLEAKLGIRISPDALSAPVTATAVDSAVFDIEHNNFSLYGNATAKYEDVELDGGRIQYNQITGIITASPVVDSLADTTARPTFSQGSEKFTYDSLQYNFKTKRAIVRNARTQYGEGYVFATQVKRNPDQSIFGYKGVYTTCSLDTPHFGIRARRIKVIPGHIIVSGAANLEIEGVPTPLYLPFGVFPITETQRSGFQIPSYTLEERRGLGLTRGGYYFYLNDYVDLLLLADIYSKGSYNTYLTSTYANRYHYGGAFSFQYGYEKTGEVYEPNASNTRTFKIQWRHQTDPKAHPGTAFNSNVNIIKNNFDQENGFYTQQIIQNQYQSNITYSKTWQGKPYSLSVSGNHNQNTQTRLVNVQLPHLNFYISQINPFQRKNGIGTQRWYEKITTSYNLDALAQTQFYDSAFSLRNLSLSDFQTGIHHSIPVQASYTAFRYVNVSFGLAYNEYWLQQQLYQYYDRTEGKLDSISHQGFFANRDFNATVQFSTRIYGMKLWKKGTLAGIRHVLTPNVSFNYTPDFAASPYRNYYRTYLSSSGSIQYLSPYVTSPVGSAGLNQYGDFSSNIAFGLNNNLQIKTRKGSDTGAVTKNITLIDGLSINSGYNIAADSFKWAGVALGFRTDILNLISISANANFDPYVYDNRLGRRVDQLLAGNGGGLVRFTNASAAVTASFHSKQNAAASNGEAAASTDEGRRLLRNGGIDNYVDFKIPWTLNLSYALTVTRDARAFSAGGDTTRIDQGVLFSGDFNLTPKLKIGFSSGYNVTQHQLNITQVDIYRDLHCWEMRLHTIPFGPNRQYTFTLSVKAGVLQDLRLLRRRDYRDAVY